MTFCELKRIRQMEGLKRSIATLSAQYKLFPNTLIYNALINKQSIYLSIN